MQQQQKYNQKMFYDLKKFRFITLRKQYLQKHENVTFIKLDYVLLTHCPYLFYNNRFFFSVRFSYISVFLTIPPLAVGNESNSRLFYLHHKTWQISKTYLLFFFFCKNGCKLHYIPQKTCFLFVFVNHICKKVVLWCFVGN